MKNKAHKIEWMLGILHALKNGKSRSHPLDIR